MIDYRYGEESAMEKEIGMQDVLGKEVGMQGLVENEAGMKDADFLGKESGEIMTPDQLRKSYIGYSVTMCLCVTKKKILVL